MQLKPSPSSSPSLYNFVSGSVETTIPFTTGWVRQLEFGNSKGSTLPFVDFGQI
jgi:hypothetical protein